MLEILKKLQGGWMKLRLWTQQTDLSTPNVQNICWKQTPLRKLKKCVLSLHGFVALYWESLESCGPHPLGNNFVFFLTLQSASLSSLNSVPEQLWLLASVIAGFELILDNAIGISENSIYKAWVWLFLLGRKSTACLFQREHLRK